MENTITTSHQPTFELKAFVCPHCNVLAEQIWSFSIQCHYHYTQPNGSKHAAVYELENTASAKCCSCHAFSLWLHGHMFYPSIGNVELANTDLPKDVMNDYIEALKVVNISAKCAVALLRLALTKLCTQLAHRRSLEENISQLIRRGLPKELEQGLLMIRCIGRNAIPPGCIDNHDKLETAFALFSFINTISDFFITQPRKIREAIENLPRHNGEQ
ncbi:MAG: DUF4145 domain-containing protein [Cytophagia bacterium]|nr:DUF4145 domain-containing protein [Cytophagia bacterium]